METGGHLVGLMPRRRVGGWEGAGRLSAVASLLIVIGMAAGTTALTAQTPAAAAGGAPGADTLTAATVEGYVRGLAADSLRDRDTPSLGLDRAAQYVATRFRRLGLKPGAVGDAWIWRYPIPGQLSLDKARSHVRFSLAITHGGKDVLTEAGADATKEVVADFTTAAHFVSAVGPPLVALSTAISFFDIQRMGSAQVVVLAGPHTVASAAQVAVQGKVVIYLPALTADSAARQRILERLYAESQGVVLVSDSGRFPAVLGGARERVPVVDRYMREATGPRRWPWAVAVPPTALHGFLSAAGLDPVWIHTDSTAVVHEIPSAQVWLEPVADTTPPPVTAPVVAGLLEGTDSVLKQEYLVISAHMDQNLPPKRPDSLRPAPGADAGDVGTAGLLALAQVFSQPGARPRRSLLFLATSGGAAGKAFWGTNAYLDPSDGGGRALLPGIMAVLDLGRLDRPTGDSILIDGLHDVELAPRAEWVAAKHPELGLVVAAGETAVQPNAGHFPFVRFGIPSLSFHVGSHATVAAGGSILTADEVERIARLLRFVGYVGRAVADAERRPRWTAAGRERLGELQGR